jgi:hypothetical protein
MQHRSPIHAEWVDDCDECGLCADSQPSTVLLRERRAAEMARRNNGAKLKRWTARLEAGMLVGMVVGCLVGIWLGMLGNAASVWFHTVEPFSPGLTPLVAEPAISGILGAMIGVIVGGLIGWTMCFEFSLRRPNQTHRHLVGGER